MRTVRLRTRRSVGRRRLLLLGGLAVLLLVTVFLVVPVLQEQGSSEKVNIPNRKMNDVAKAPVSRPLIASRGEAQDTTASTASILSPSTTTQIANAEPSTTAAPVRADGLYATYAAELEELAALDLFKLRGGESRITFAQFADCLGRMLDVDAVARTEVPRLNTTRHDQAPLLISVTMGNTQDLKAMICNLTVSYRYVTLAQNGETPEMTPFFALLSRVFDFTSRLVVLRFPENIGYAGAVNAGLREALRHLPEVVPFVHIIHNDVRYIENGLLYALTEAYDAVSRDTGVFALLEKEVRSEPNEFTPPLRRPHGLRAPITADGPLPQRAGADSVLVTSSLLPDRVRYLPEVKRRNVMQGRISFMFHNSNGAYTSVFLSRLAIVMTGFFDENYYPVLFEDTDYRWRAHMLGFEELYFEPLDSLMITYDVDCTNINIEEGERWGWKNGVLLPGNMRRRNKPTLSPAAVALLQECNAAFSRGVQFTYLRTKWGPASMDELARPVTNRQPFSTEAFSGKRHLPLDAWVISSSRVRAVQRMLRDTGPGGLLPPPYNPDCVLDALRLQEEGGGGA